jgi:hypothetical protein
VKAWADASSADARMRDLDDLFAALAGSRFRRRFALGAKDREYLDKKGLSTVLEHARDLIARRLAPAAPANDGRQTPFRAIRSSSPSTRPATCCRGCLAKWHGIAKGRPLGAAEQVMSWAAIGRWLEAQRDCPKVQ